MEVLLRCTEDSRESIYATPETSVDIWPTSVKTIPGFLPICQNQIQGLFKDFQSFKDNTKDI